MDLAAGTAEISAIDTPAYVFDGTVFAERAKAIRSILGEGMDLCFSMKANPFMLSVLPGEIDRVEACSPGELTICGNAGLDMGRVVYSGVSKGSADVRQAIRSGVCALTAESPQQYELICREARSLCLRTDVLLRLTDGSQFGMDAGELTRIVSQRASHPEIRLKGIHYFTGTGKRSTGAVSRQLAMLESLAGSLKAETGFAPELMEYGPGLDAEYFLNEDGASPADELERLREIVPALRRLAGIARVTVEIGRLLAAPCGSYYSKVCDTKTNKGVNYAILDGGLHQMRYDGQLQGMRLPVMTVIRDGTVIYTADRLHSSEGASAEKEHGRCLPADELWTLYGSLCSTADIFVRDARLPRLRVGDTVVFHNTGAYSVCEGIALFLSRDLPQVWLRASDGSLRLLRGSTPTYCLNYLNYQRS